MPHNYFVRYLPLMIETIVGAGLALAMVLLSAFLGKHRYSRAKFQPYECGMNPIGDSQGRFSVKFYLVGMLFILFDVEAVFLFPWAVILKDLKMFGFWEMMIYIAIVLVGLFYIWKKGVLDWNIPEAMETVGMPNTPDFRPAHYEVSDAFSLDAEPVGVSVEGGRR